MNAEPIRSVELSVPIYHALTLVAGIDKTTRKEIVERVVAAYLKGRIRAIRETQQERNAGRGRVIDLAARRAARRATRSSRSTGSRGRSSSSSE